MSVMLHRMPSAKAHPIRVLTDTHRRALQLAADGHTAREIADEMNYSHHHVRMLLAQAIHYLGARNITHACVLGMGRGVIS